MRICYINPALLLRRPIAEIITRTAKTNEVGLLIPKPLFKSRDDSLHYSKLPPGVRIYTYSVIQPGGAYEWPIPVTPIFFVQLFRVFWRYDVVHMWAQFYLANFFACIFGLLFKTKLILTMDTIAGYSFSAGERYDKLFRLYYRIFGWLIFGAPEKITLYGRSLMPFARMAGIKMAKVDVIPTGIDVKKPGDGSAIRREFGIKDEKVVLYVGLLVPRKGVETLIEVIAKLKGENIKVLLVGDGPMRKEYEVIAKKKGITSKLIFTGFRKDVFDFYAAADVFFFPSRGEGLPGVLMEAMCCGLSVVTSNIPCIPDLVEDGKNGFLCKLDDNECLGARLKQLLDNPELRKKVGAAGVEKIKEFSWEQVIGKYTDMYKTLAQTVSVF